MASSPRINSHIQIWNSLCWAETYAESNIDMLGKPSLRRVHRGNPFRKAAERERPASDAPDLWAPARCAHPRDPGRRPHGATELSRSREIKGDRGRARRPPTLLQGTVIGSRGAHGTAPSTQLLPTPLRSTCAVTRGRHAHTSGRESRRAARRARRPHAQRHGAGLWGEGGGRARRDGRALSSILGWLTACLPRSTYPCAFLRQ